MAERRLVSVLFADLVGFTTLSEQRDPEETRELLSRYFDASRELIARYGGVVEKFIGDAVMAVFGAPVAHEDDAERAVRAALELVDAVAALGGQVEADELRLRAGVLTGEAAVTLGAEGQGMVAGDLVNTASRLQSAAAPGTVLVGEATYRAAREAIAFEDAGEHVLKGKELPVRAHRALRVIAGHGGFRRTDTLEAPFVGRDQELRLLKEALHATGRERRPRLISVMGMGGVGKSRLAWEFFKYIDGLVETIYWHQGRCPAYGEGVTFWALGEMVRMRARITETEDPNSAFEKLTHVLEEHVADDDQRHWIEPRLAQLVGLREGAMGEREELFAAWRMFFERIADNGTTVLVFEDLQWADDGLVDFVEHTLEWARSSPILIVTLARPELMEHRPTWGAGQRSFTSLHLHALGDDEMRKLLSGLAEGLPDFVADQIVERAEGVPLYAVEMVRMLVDQGHLVCEEGEYRLSTPPDRLEVPHTLHALIASRLDGLQNEDRALLQDASVLGKTFTLEALAAIRQEDARKLQAALQSLVRKELLVVEGDPWSPERGQYGFMQSLIREVAYGTLAKPERRSRHLMAASYFEAMGDELAGVVAAHLIEAQQASPAGKESEELASRACAALAAAAERARSLGAHSQAFDYFARALEISDEATERARLLEKAADSADDAGNHDAAEKYAAQALDSYESLGDQLGVARAGAVLGLALARGGRPRAAVETMKGVLGRVLGLESEEDVVRLVGHMASAHMLASEPEPAIEYADRALLAAERLGHVRLVTEVLVDKANSFQQLGRWLESTILLRGAAALAADSGHLMEAALASGNLANGLLLADPSQALTVARSSLAQARTLGLQSLEWVNVLNAGEAAVSTGEWDWVEEAVVETNVERLSEFERAIIELIEARIRALRGEASSSRELLQRAKPCIESAESPLDLANLHETDAILALTEGRLQDGVDYAARAVAADPFSANGIRSYLLGGRAALWSREAASAEEQLETLAKRGLHGAWLDANRQAIEAGVLALRGHADKAAALYRDCGLRFAGLYCPFELAMCWLDFVMLVPDHPEARSGAENAREIFKRLGAKPFLERLDAALSSTIPSSTT